MCRVDRLAGGVGLCGQTNAVRVACAGLHFGEEPPISGKLGSGTVFFSGCTLRCSFCQNWQISHNGLGDGVSPETLADIFMALERDGAANINLVTGTPFVPGIISAHMLILCGDTAAIPLKILFNNILSTGVYPNIWKMANDTPIHKKDDKQKIINSRPISLLPICGKILEKIIFNQLYTYLTNNDLITNKQSVTSKTTLEVAEN